MMGLTILSVAWAAILVLVLAVGLIAILAALIRIERGLGQIATGLKVVEAQTAPLKGHLEVVNSTLISVGGGMKSVNTHLAAADEALGRVGGVLSGRGR